MAKSSTGKSGKSTTSTPSTTTTTTTAETVVATPAPATPAPTPAPQERTKKSSKNTTPATPAVATPAVAPVVETPVVAPVVATPAPAQEGKSKKSKAKSAEPAAVATPAPAPVQEVAATQEGGKSKKAKKSSKPAEPEPTPAPSVAPTVATEGDDCSGSGKRFFRCVYRAADGSFVNGGRYSGKKPKQAASKALKAIVKKNNVTTGEEVTFLIQECTRGSKKKKYSYKGSQVDLAEPVKIKITKKDGSAGEIAYRKHSVVKKIRLEECGDLVNAGFEDEFIPPEQPVEVKVQATPRTKSASSKKSKSKATRGSKKTTKA